MMKEKSKWEVWAGYRPSIRRLRVFGCVCYVHVNRLSKRIDFRRNDKFDAVAIKCRFVGYDQEYENGYRVLTRRMGKY